MAAKKATAKKKPAAKKPAAQGKIVKGSFRVPAAKKPAAKKRKPAAKAASTRSSKAPAKAKAKAKPALVGPFQVALDTRVAGGLARTDRISQHRLYSVASSTASSKLNTILRNQKKNPVAGRKVRVIVVDLGTNKLAGASGWHAG